MLLIGTMNWSSTRMSGMFQCPTCGGSQNFRLKSTRPFLTLYFIPVVPIGGLEEYVECRNCREAFEPVVLTNHLLPADTPAGVETPNQNEQAFEKDLLSIIALMMVEDGHVTENEITIARRVFENMTGQTLSREQLGASCSQVQLHRLSIESFLATATQRRSHEEKLLMLQAIFGVASADGQVSEGRMQSLIRSQRLLEIDEQEFETAIAATGQWLS
ncbi:MAG: TerB family tellurite resistance protein [Planctomycetota bacterium]